MRSKLSDDVLSVHSEIDRSIESLKQRFPIDCPIGCGDCCRSPNVEASILEMLPVAETVFDTQEIDFWLAALDDRQGEPACVFYTPDRLSFGQGRCAVYPLRPSMCRLFGYSAVRNKRGALTFAPCRVVRQQRPQAVELAERAVAEGDEILCISEASARVANVEPALGNRRLPINEAFRLAIERVGLAHAMIQQDDDSILVPLLPEDKAPRPRKPRNAA